MNPQLHQLLSSLQAKHRQLETAAEQDARDDAFYNRVLAWEIGAGAAAGAVGSLFFSRPSLVHGAVGAAVGAGLVGGFYVLARNT